MDEQEFNKISEQERMNRVLEGTAFFAHIHAPDLATAKRFSADPCFSIKLGLDEANQAKAISYGLKIRPADEWVTMPHVEIKRKIKPKSGKTFEELRDAAKPVVVDSMQSPVPDTLSVGNKSKVVVKFGTYWYPNMGGGVGTTLFKVQIRELVEYVRAESGFVTDATGYVASAKATNDLPLFDDEDGFKDPSEFDVKAAG